MYLLGSHRQHIKHHIYDASGTISTGGTAQLIIPRVFSRTQFIFVNNSTSVMYLETGGARASAAVSTSGATSGTVTGVTVTNAGFNYSLAPLIIFYAGGGLNPNNSNFLGPIPPTGDFPAPIRPAQAHCVMTGSAPNMSISSIVIDDPGAGYLYPPYVYIGNNENDPNGAAVPSVGVGMYIAASGGNLILNGTACTTDQWSVFCATTSSSYSCKWMY
jgi:hypothetical protein